MERLTVLGTGNAMVTEYYNTCFAVDDGEEYFLVDAGGGNGILRQMKAAGIPFGRVHHMFVTHGHTDHILGTIWVIRKISSMMKSRSYDGIFTIYCQESLEPVIRSICLSTLQEKFTALFDTRILFHPIRNGQTEEILGRKLTFFDIYSTKAEQHGFRMQLKNQKILVCLGDEPYNPRCKSYAEGADWMFCEAFCMYEDRDWFEPYKKHHSTVKEACETEEELGVQNLVLWHTEDTHPLNRKALYLSEGKNYFHGNLYVPEDLEVLEL